MITINNFIDAHRICQEGRQPFRLLQDQALILINSCQTTYRAIFEVGSNSQVFNVKGSIETVARASCGTACSGGFSWSDRVSATALRRDALFLQANGQRDSHKTILKLIILATHYDCLSYF
jgi:hypothetical protein